MGIETPHPLSVEYRQAAGDSASFRQMSSILDMALASAESATALEKEIEGGNDAIAASKHFFHDVHHKIVFIDSCGPVRHINLGDHSAPCWKPKHVRFLTQAEEVTKLLAPFSTTSKSRTSVSGSAV